MSATIHSLAPELLDHILDLVRGPGVSSLDSKVCPSNSHLLSAALVCRAWAEAAQLVLWRDARITLDQGKPFPALPESKHPVKHIWIAFQKQTVPASQAKAGATGWALALQKMAPHLRSLCLSNYSDEVDPEGNFLRAASLCGPERLDLEFVEGSEDPIETDIPFPFHLTHLGFTLFMGTPPHLVPALFATSRDTLTSLRCTFDTYGKWTVLPSFSDELDIIGPRLKSLEINNIGDMPTNAPQCFQFNRLSSLTHFHFAVCDGSKQLPSYLDLLPSPATVTYLAFVFFEDDEQQLQEIADLLPHPALQNLKQVGFGVCGFESLGGSAAAVSLIEEFERRSIRFDFWLDIGLGD
ncbi:hypothetical protein RQP46_003687 [Phenoliferia psychrophenolica]